MQNFDAIYFKKLTNRLFCEFRKKVILQKDN